MVCQLASSSVGALKQYGDGHRTPEDSHTHHAQDDRQPTLHSQARNKAPPMWGRGGALCGGCTNGGRVGISTCGGADRVGGIWSLAHDFPFCPAYPTRHRATGKIMRSTSLDELPQLINVLKGEMSLVGPRPERPQFVEFFEIQIHRDGERHRVKAGITGWAQVHGLRGQTSIADRVEWDNYYIENWSLALDLKILALTVVAVMRGAE
jgi:hypothetical protein